LPSPSRMLEHPIAALDFECSGHGRNGENVAVEIGLIILHPSGRIEVVADSLLSGASRITYHAWRTHGISIWQCRGKPRLEAFREKIKFAAQWPICVHAKGTEKKVLQEELGLGGFTFWDSLLLGRQRLRGTCPNFQLKTLAEHMGVTEKLKEVFPQGKWHRAAYDAAASAMIVKKLKETATEKEKTV